MEGSFRQKHGQGGITIPAISVLRNRHPCMRASEKSQSDTDETFTSSQSPKSQPKYSPLNVTLLK
uniref:Uncharacterized protein n=1 Tax=Ralstonia solanacearum TaxID=305 RepID=A0A0S4UT45_RALSL|nr:protein of unknown function [Ralstonia solanacearum]